MEFHYVPACEHSYEPAAGWLVIAAHEVGAKGTAQPLDAEKCAKCGELKLGAFTAPAQRITVVGPA